MLQAVPLPSENDIRQTQILMRALIGQQYFIVNEVPCCLSDSSRPAGSSVCEWVCKGAQKRKKQLGFFFFLLLAGKKKKKCSTGWCEMTAVHSRFLTTSCYLGHAATTLIRPKFVLSKNMGENRGFVQYEWGEAWEIEEESLACTQFRKYFQTFLNPA